MLYRAGYDFNRLFTISEFYDRERNPSPQPVLDALNMQPLLLLAQHDEVGRPAAHAHTQVAVLLRVGHGAFEFLHIGDGER